jgi:hypothetical protein
LQASTAVPLRHALFPAIVAFSRKSGTSRRFLDHRRTTRMVSLTDQPPLARVPLILSGERATDERDTEVRGDREV